MKYRKFADTDIELSRLGLGAMGMSFSYGQKDDVESLKTLDLAYELGINFWDTADIYGNGANEELLSKALKGRRDKIFLATKFGNVFEEQNLGFVESGTGHPMHIDGSAKHIKEAIDASLKRLDTDYIDLYYMHRPDPKTPIEESMEALADLVKVGKIRYIGVSEFSADLLKKANSVAKISALQSEYSLITRTVENEILPLTKELHMTFVPFSPLVRGLLSNSLDVSSLDNKDFRSNNPRFQDEALTNNQKLAAELAQLAADKDCTPAQLALAWVIRQQDNIIPIPGTKHQKYLKENAAAVDIMITEEENETLKNLLVKYPKVGARY